MGCLERRRLEQSAAQLENHHIRQYKEKYSSAGIYDILIMIKLNKKIY